MRWGGEKRRAMPVILSGGALRGQMKYPSEDFMPKFEPDLSRQRWTEIIGFKVIIGENC